MKYHLNKIYYFTLSSKANIFHPNSASLRYNIFNMQNDESYTTKAKSLLKSKIFITYFVWYNMDRTITRKWCKSKKKFFLLKWKRWLNKNCMRGCIINFSWKIRSRLCLVRFVVCKCLTENRYRYCIARGCGREERKYHPNPHYNYFSYGST